MSMDLTAFLAENVIQVESVKYAASSRFVKDGKPIEWEIKAISSTDDEALRKDCTRRVPVAGKKGQYSKETDIELYMGRLAAACTAYPDLDNAALQDNYHVKSADALLKAMLLPGEYLNYVAKVQQVCGFDTSMDERVEEAKN